MQERREDASQVTRVGKVKNKLEKKEVGKHFIRNYSIYSVL